MNSNESVINTADNTALTYDKIYDFENLYKAHKAARRGKQTKREVINYDCFMAENIKRLQYQLENRSYRISGYRKFIIHDPKTR